MYGAVAGDIIGSIYEFSNHKSREFPLFLESSFFTDDTVCTVAVAEALHDGSDPAHALKKWGTKFPNAGYGGRFAAWLRGSDMRPYNSYGNGAAMRVSPAGFLAESLDEAIDLAINPIESEVPGALGGNRSLKIYGKLDCPNALRWIAKGHYVSNRVFFLDTDSAVAAGYRPCGICLREECRVWKARQSF